MLKIGVVVNEKQEISSFLDGVKVVIYEKKESTWLPACEIENYLKDKEAIPLMREYLKKLILELEDCKILVASIVTGIPFMMLDKEGFMLCEAEEISNQLFEEIAYDYAKIEQEKEKPSKTTRKDYPTKPFETKEPGIFELDLRKLQESHPEVSSKMAIIPFLKETTFYQLNIYCDHIMPWVEHNPAMLGYEYETSKLDGNGYVICISKKSCN